MIWIKYTDFTYILLNFTKFEMNMRSRCRKLQKTSKAEYHNKFSVIKCKMKTQNKDNCISTLFPYPLNVFFVLYCILFNIKRKIALQNAYSKHLKGLKSHRIEFWDIIQQDHITNVINAFHHWFRINIQAEGINIDHLCWNLFKRNIFLINKNIR